MYVNPFERMRKKREEEDKKRSELEKEREKYARLGAQMGFTDDKAVVPSFIKTLIGETNQSKVPPFGMAMDNDFDNLPESTPDSQPMMQSSNRTMEDFEKQFGGSNNGTSISQAPSFGSPLDGNNSGMPSFEPQMSQDFAPQQPSMPSFEPQMSQDFAPQQPSMPSFEPQMSQDFAPQQPSMPSFEPQMNQSFVQQQPSMPSFEREDEFTYNNANLNNNVEDELMLQKSFDEKFDDFFETEEVEIHTDKIITTNNYLNLKNSNEIKEKNILIVDSPNLIDKKELVNLVDIDLSKVVLYSSPCLFMLKRFINSLPEVITLDDKRDLWERTSLFLAATEWGKTGSEIDFILEELNLTADPIGMFVDEFKILFESYGFNEPINIVLNASKDVKLEQILFINEFVSNLIMKIPNVSCVINVDREVIDIRVIEEILYNYDYVVSDEILIPETKVVQQVPQQQETIVEQNNNYQSIQPQENYYEQQKMVAQPQDTFQQPTWNVEEPVREIKQESSLDQFFTEELKDVSMDLFERPEENEIMLTYDKEDSNFTGNIPGISNSNFVDTHNSSQLPGFAKDHQEEAFEEEEDYDPGIDSNLRIHVDQVLEAKKMEILEQEKREELDRLERKGESGFDPSIISKKEVILNPYANPFEGINIQSPLSARSEKIADPRPRNEIEGKLKEMNQDLSNRKPISIEESFANEKNKDKDKKLISVPGNWEKL
ncbi:hypothetical protein [Spiroplasma sp. BIUS-1]|uniref:hypothetical protein n=1 Tax=Spiroplasma sp. BIUS-1 TaxID=216964 RepID=UPI0013996FCE|nr:hypothetical protein [Spiroplasma sp. BIUS-1]QHX37044.1 hypothetical protein SBIUS_v1c07910 [Spiroplasma sp. BIUS-1]